MLAGAPDYGRDLLNLNLPCPSSTNTVEALVKCLYSDGILTMSPELLLPMLQLADAVQVSNPELACADRSTYLMAA